MKRLLLTGATGLIGREIPVFLKNEEFDVFALTRNTGALAKDSFFTPVRCNLFDGDSVRRVLKETKADYLLHLAWDTTPGVYLHSPQNEHWRKASLNLLENFAKAGGRRAVFAGTCLEYARCDGPLAESHPLDPRAAYAEEKCRLNAQACAFCRENGLSYSWGRIFYAYGRGEHPSRLIPDILNCARSNTTLNVRTSSLRRDYIYSKDVALAFSKLLASRCEGDVNISTGTAVSIEDIVRTAFELLRLPLKAYFKNEDSGQFPLILGDNSKLKKETGFTPRYSLREALAEIIRQSE